MKRFSGEVIFLPPDSDPAGDPKERRHVLLNDCEVVGGNGTLAFASRAQNEAFYGRAFCIIDPETAAYSTHGFDRLTFVYLNRLVTAAAEDLEAARGKVLDEMACIRELLPQALGFGTGTTTGPGAARGTLRGCVVSFSRRLAEEAGTQFGVVVTNPLYSRARRYQHVVPIYPTPPYAPGEHNVVLGHPGVTALFGEGTTSAFAAVPFIFSGYHDREVISPVGVIVTGEQMAEIEDALRTHFGLSGVAGLQSG